MIRKIFNEMLEILGSLDDTSARKSNGVPVGNTARTWREAARSDKSGRKMYDGLMKELSGSVSRRVNNVLLQSCKRTTLTNALPTSVIKYIRAESMKGRRAGSISKSLQSKLPEMTKEQLESICRTVISKAGTALECVRAKELDLNWYTWKTSQDGRVRNSHKIMQGVLVHWDDPPSPEYLNGENSIGVYHAGEAEDCRCYPAPVVRLDLVGWPHKVYIDGKIVNMTIAQFKKVYQASKRRKGEG